MTQTTTINPTLVDACQTVRPLLCDHLIARNLMTADQIWKSVIQYRLGATRDHGTVFWRIDTAGCVHDGRIAFHTPDCNPDPARPSTWVSTRLRALGTLPSEWQRTDCLFGEHLLRETNTAKIIAIIQSEKSAIICNNLFPCATWLATGDGTPVSVETLVRLHRITNGADIILFPHTDPDGSNFRRCEQTAITAAVRNTKPIYVSDILEHISPDQKTAKPDLIAWLSKIRLPTKTPLTP